MFEDFKFLSEIPLLVTYIKKKNDSQEYVDDNFISLSNLKGVCISNITLPCLLCLGMAGWLWRAKKERDGEGGGRCIFQITSHCENAVNL